jgi:drug/metabolite transporter (DMT)-like permease
MNRLTFNIGYIELSLAQFCLGINIVLGRILAPTCPILLLLSIRFLIGFGIIAIYLYFRSATQVYQEVKGLQKGDWIVLFLQALCGGFLFNTLTLYGLQYTSATTASIVNSTIPAFVALFSFFILKEALTKHKVFAISLAIIGILLLSIGNATLPTSAIDLLGILCIFLAIIPGALFIVLGKMLKTSVNVLTVTAFINLFNTLLFFPLAFNRGLTLFINHSYTTWFQIFLYGISGSILFFIFWYRGLVRVTANTAALFVGIMPISTTILAYFILDESLSGFEVLGMCCVVVSIFIGTLNSSK